MGSKLHANQGGQPMTSERKTTANTGFASGGVTCKLGLCAPIQVQCRQFCAS